MGGLYKKEVLVKPTSTATTDGAIEFTKNWLNNTFQNKEDNLDENGNYKDYFFADVFDSRNGNILRVFSDACEAYYGMTELVFEVLNTSKFATATALEETNTLITVNAEAIGNIEPTDITEIENTLVEHTDRIVALENTQDDEVQAIVI